MKRLLSACLATAAAFAATQQKPLQKNTPAWDADLYRRNEAVFSTHLEFLYWKTQEGDLDYALKMQAPSWGPLNNYAQGKYETGSFDIDPGFRISLSYFRAPKEWEVWGSYTHFNSSGHDSASKPSQDNLYIVATWPTALNAVLSEASTHTHLNYNVAELLVDRYANPNAHLRLRFLGGLTSAWIDQYWAIKYTAASGETTSIANKWSFAGGGLRIGTHIDWFWTSDIYLTARATFAGLMGCYKNHAKQTTTYAQGASYDTTLPIRNATYQDGRAAFNAQLLAGPSWQKNFSSCRAEIFVGYELNVWANLQEIFRSTAGNPDSAKETWTNTSLLSLQGLTARWTMDY